MRIGAIALTLIAATPAGALEPVLNPGEYLEARLNADIDGDGTADVAYVTRTDDQRNLQIAYAVNGAEYLPLDITPLGSGSLTFAKGVLVFEDLTGGTSATASTRRYRFDKADNRMRLIGLDATYYSRTYAHDGFELSWNLLDGKLVTRELRLNRKGGDAAYDPIIEKTLHRPSGKVWLIDTPDPDELIEQVDGH